MANIKIVTDSSAGLTEEEIKQYNITIVPLSVMIDGTIYVERETITAEEFPDVMEAAKSLPKTSQPPIGKFVDVFDRLGKDGSEVLCVNMMESISGTVHAAEQAAAMSSAEVTVVDSQVTDRCLAFQIIEAAKLIEQGADMAEVLAKMENVRDTSKIYLAIMKLDNLVAGGRISRFSGALSNLLNIKLMLEVVKGQIEIKLKGRGMKPINKFLNDVYADMAAGKKVTGIGISHVRGGAEVEKMKAKLTELFPDIKIVERTTVPIIATHTGMGAYCLLYYTE
ncbi:DegV family protein [Paucilactobacillus oligofermentans DSM 15707 = LMG 22743]|uniref:DegV family protein n=1 Tax=Paucilactobacillus oligofermentans DSM 15707 = LMG 22743 TaxID=1423778 RepID=A0A0R1RKL9_9LACO|nr:DegV family protein [Paucilactobacillus oligofermentans]KRL54834.1 DegV family protein [Paucilactobacillus oligofermentans DSM 15707 = LMG 22743]CUS26251.1 DegV family protein [Paucilactobacillus oligofermentans DSM 15707 = LMG 22743]